MASCVSYLPPSTLHHDMIQNQHPMIKDSTVQESQIIYGSIQGIKSWFHHRRDPEIERNKAWSVRAGYGFAERWHSAGLSLNYSAGHLFDNDGKRYGHRNISFKGSYALDFHEGKCHGHILKIQGAASRGYGRYQDLLRANYENRDEYNLAIASSEWLYSIGYGSQFKYELGEDHDAGLGLFFNHSSDFKNNGFHAEYFNMELSYVYLEKYRLLLAGMLDARFSPRGETVVLGLGYLKSF